jgi:hypothetical protein
VMLTRPPEPSLYQAPVNSFRLLASCPQPITRASMHALRFLWERIERARRAGKSKPDLLRLAEASINRRFLLARIDEAAAASAFKQFTGGKHNGVQLCSNVNLTATNSTPSPRTREVLASAERWSSKAR